MPKHARMTQEPPTTALIYTQTPLTPPPVIFPLSTNHLLHLVQYNVFHAFISSKRTLNTLFLGGTNNPPSPTTCLVSGPYHNNTIIYPLNPNIPLSLVLAHL
jgi:hypothetical protein